MLDIEFVESDIFGRIKKYGPRMSSLLKFVKAKEAAQRKQIEEARRIMSEAQYKDMERKKDLVVTVRDWEHDALQNRDARLPYSAHISLVSRGMRDTSKWGEGK